MSNLIMYLSNLVASISIVVGLVLTICGATKNKAFRPGSDRFSQEILQ